MAMNVLKRLKLKWMQKVAATVIKRKLYLKSMRGVQYPICITLAPVVFEVVRCGMNLGIFDELDKKEGQTLSELSTALGLQQYPLEICLRVLEYSQFLVEIDSRYYNEPCNVLSFLTKHQEIFATSPTLEYMHKIVAPACAYLEESVRDNQPRGLHHLYGKGRNFYAAISENKEDIACFDKFMASTTEKNKDRVTSDPFFGRRRRILDVGGSTGTIALSLAGHHESLEVTVLDFPDVLKITEQRFKEQGLDGRLKTHTGNPLETLPSGYDCVLFFHFVDIFSPAENVTLLKNAYSALPSGGAVAIFTPVTFEHMGSPGDLFGPYFLCLAEGKGRFYTEENIGGWLKETGYTDVAVKELPFTEVLITAKKP